MNRNSSGRRYDREFKNNAVALVRGGRTITEVARDLGVSKWSLGHWVRRAGLKATLVTPRPRNLPSRKGEFYEEATRGRSASHHLQIKAALALLYHVLGSTNPFAECPAPKFAPEKTELRYHTSSQFGQLVRELREDRRSYFGHLTYHLAVALFF